MQITLNQILDTVRASEKKFWNINSSACCPAAATGKKLIHTGFLMDGFYFGGTFKDGKYVSHSINTKWAEWTRTYCFSDQNENEAASASGYLHDAKAVFVSKETILKQFNDIEE